MEKEEMIVQMGKLVACLLLARPHLKSALIRERNPAKKKEIKELIEDIQKITGIHAVEEI